MALVLDGNGTMTVGNGSISGLSVGGLPTGVINSTNITDATIAQGDLDTTIIPIGAGQTWTNVASSRALGTTYTNSTGRPIVVAVQQQSTGGPTGFSGGFTINSVGMPAPYSYSPNAGYASAVFYIVPNGATYACATSATSLGLWYELR